MDGLFFKITSREDKLIFVTAEDFLQAAMKLAKHEETTQENRNLGGNKGKKERKRRAENIRGIFSFIIEVLSRRIFQRNLFTLHEKLFL